MSGTAKIKPPATRDDLIKLRELITQRRGIAAQIQTTLDPERLQFLDNELMDLSEQIVAIDERVELPAELRAALNGANR